MQEIQRLKGLLSKYEQPSPSTSGAQDFEPPPPQHAPSQNGMQSQLVEQLQKDKARMQKIIDSQSKTIAGQKKMLELFQRELRKLKQAQRSSVVVDISGGDDRAYQPM